jgi:RHS repeat-associated protein
MSIFSRKNVLCRYHYDALDRLVNCAPFDENGIQSFYCRNRLATEVQGPVQHSIFQHDNQLLAQRRREDVEVEVEVDTTLLATDQQRSVLNVLGANRTHPLGYTPYGHRSPGNGLLSLLGFNGERADPVTGHYLLGMGYRAYNPVLMCFNSPDEMSPFDRGGINPYIYCLNDPINRTDPTGYFSIYSLTRPFKYLYKKITQRHYNIESYRRSAASEILKNRDDYPSTNAREDKIANDEIIKNNLKITWIMHKRHLEILKSTDQIHKFILTRDNHLIIGSYVDPDSLLDPKHSAIARLAAPSFRFDKEVVSAGVITRVRNGYKIINDSGHYQPPPKSNTLAKFRLRGLGVNATSKNYETGFL